MIHDDHRQAIDLIHHYLILIDVRHINVSELDLVNGFNVLRTSELVVAVYIFVGGVICTCDSSRNIDSMP